MGVQAGARPASFEETQYVKEMQAIASDPNLWEDFHLPLEMREQILLACTQWLRDIGARPSGHTERE